MDDLRILDAKAEKAVIPATFVESDKKDDEFGEETSLTESVLYDAMLLLLFLSTLTDLPVLDRKKASDMGDRIWNVLNSEEDI